MSVNATDHSGDPTPVDEAVVEAVAMGMALDQHEVCVLPAGFIQSPGAAMGRQEACEETADGWLRRFEELRGGGLRAPGGMRPGVEHHWPTLMCMHSSRPGS